MTRAREADDRLHLRAPTDGPPKRRRGRFLAIVAAVGLVVGGAVVLIVVRDLTDHNAHKNVVAAGDLVGAPPAPQYRVGQTARSGGFAFTVYGVKVPFSSDAHYPLPTPGYVYVQVDVQVTNTRSSDEQFSSMLAFHLSDSRNHPYGEAIVAGIQPIPPDGPISPGQALRGFVMFEVPTSATGLTMRCQGSLTAAGAVFTLT